MNTSAPGKLVLVGEYAVLEGAPALVLAVDRYAMVRCDERPTPSSTLIVDAPEIGLANAVLVRPDLTGPAVDALALVHDRLRELPHTVHRVTLDTSAFFLGPDKLGLGSSAALTVALERAIDTGADNEQLFRRAFTAHRAFQKGAGSGIDLAASVHGGVLRYRLRGEELPECTPTPWPDELSVLAVWSGNSANTRSFVGAVNAFAAREKERYADIMGGLSALSAQACSAFSEGRIDAFLDGVGRYGEGLARLGSAAEIPIETAEHARIGAIARSRGARYKPAGAGGGDLGVAFCWRNDANAVQDALKAAGCVLVPMAMATAGARAL